MIGETWMLSLLIKKKKKKKWTLSHLFLNDSETISSIQRGEKSSSHCKMRRTNLYQTNIRTEYYLLYCSASAMPSILFPS